jgi:hypothetical protein
MGEPPKDNSDLLGLTDFARRIDEIGNEALAKRRSSVESPTNTPFYARMAYRAAKRSGNSLLNGELPSRGRFGGIRRSVG